MAGEFAGKAKFGMIDVDKSEIGKNYEVEFLPTTVILKAGEVSELVVGVDAAKIQAALSSAL